MTKLRNFKLPDRLFSQSSAWNQRVDSVPIIEGNDEYLATTHRILGDKGGIWINHDEYTFPIFQMDGTSICDLEIHSYTGDQWPPMMIPWFRNSGDRVFARGIPKFKGSVRASKPDTIDSDGAIILFDPGKLEEYDFWQATTVRGQFGGVEGQKILKAGGVSWFQVDELAPGSQLPVCNANLIGTLPRQSSRATGVPYLAGLLVPEDYERREISHALAFTLPRLRHTVCPQPSDPPDYVYPATNTETNNFTEDSFALAAGMRIRLRNKIVDKTGATIDESKENAKLAPVTRIFFQALREYGAYLVDGGGGFGFSAEDQWTANLDISLEELSSLVLLDIQTTKKMLENEGKTKWQILMEKLNDQLSNEIGTQGQTAIPFAASATQCNFDVIENAAIPDVNWLRRVGQDGFTDC